jgi:hypothetical protein
MVKRTTGREARTGGRETEQTVVTLSDLWNVALEKATDRAQRLVEIGFFEVLGARNSPRYKVPFLYRDYLNLIQGKADVPDSSGEDEE